MRAVKQSEKSFHNNNSNLSSSEYCYKREIFGKVFTTNILHNA